MEYPPHERRVLFHLLRHPDHIGIIEETLRPEFFNDETCRWAFQLLLYWRHTVGYNLTLDSALEQVNKRTSDAAARERVTGLLIGLMDFQGSTRADLDNSVAELDRDWRRKRILDLTAFLAEKLAKNPESDITPEIQGLFEASNPETRGTYRTTRGASEDYERAYQRAKNATEVLGIPTGFPRIDAATGGMRKKHFWVIAAFTSQGKTALAKEVTYQNGKAGRSVLYTSLEMTEEEIMIGLYARASHDVAKQVGRGLRPLSMKRIIEGKLTATEEKLYAVSRQLVDSFDVGVWVPGDATLSDIRRRVSVEQLRRPLDLLVVDYLSLCRPERMRKNMVEEGADLMREAKRLARHENTRVIGLHQISRTGYERALTRGYYELTDLSQTSEVEKNTEVVIWSLLTPDMRACNELRLGMMKNRHGPLILDGYHVYTDFDSSIVTEHLEGATKADFFERFLRPASNVPTRS